MGRYKKSVIIVVVVIVIIIIMSVRSVALASFGSDVFVAACAHDALTCTF